MKEAIKRVFIVLIGVVLQFGSIIFIQLFLSKYIAIFTLIYWILPILLVLFILKNSTRLSNDLPWIIFIMMFPILGGIIFLTIGRSYIKSKLLRKLIKKNNEYSRLLTQKELDNGVLEENDNLRYFYNYTDYPITCRNGITYYELGELFYPELLKELKKAEKFIFMEYFIINRGKMWDGILEILKEKATNGVDVRIMYDDMGSIALLPEHYGKELAGYNIKCIPFNKVSPFNGIIMNNRDHRKMTIIDGKVAFTGGVNISDEYINLTSPYGGIWKDNGIKIVGESIWNLTVMFLTLWNASQEEDDDIEKYRHNFDEEDINEDGYVVPFGLNPALKNNIGEDVYLNIINSAKKYVYIFTPYLIIDTDMINSLIRASRRGVDVRLVVPGVPDKKIIYGITKSFFGMLIKEKVKIYTYTPGFVHSKVFVSDDVRSVVGTINMDYRSLYLHFENGIYLENNSAIKQVKRDLDEAIENSELVEEKDIKDGFISKVWQAFLRLFAPMM